MYHGFHSGDIRKMAMQYRQLGRTGLKVSVTGLGSLGFLRAKSSPEDVAKMVDRAHAGGMNFLDTGYAYGRGECDKMIGKAIEKNSSDWVILARSHMRDPAEFETTMNETFDNLRRDVLDIFQLHDITRPADYEATKQPGSIYDVALKAKEQGRIRFLGISTHATAEIVRDMIESGRYDVITISYNVANSQRNFADGEDMARTADELLPLAAEHGIGITIMKPFGGGVLVQTRIGPDGKEVSIPPLDLLRFCVTNPLVACVTPGVENVEHVDVAVAAGQAGAELSPAEIEHLKRIADIWGKDFCRKCGYCLPCTQNIVIPAALQVLETFKNGQLESGKKAYEKLDPKPDECTECGVCAERCPYSLPIPEKMKQLVQFYES